jgi:hypothetical protein
MYKNFYEGFRKNVLSAEGFGGQVKVGNIGLGPYFSNILLLIMVTIMNITAPLLHFTVDGYFESNRGNRSHHIRSRC